MCISVSVLVPSGNSSIGLGVGHCISKLQVVEEFDRRDGDKVRSSSHGSPDIASFNLPIA